MKLLGGLAISALLMSAVANFYYLPHLTPNFCQNIADKFKTRACIEK